MRLKVALLLCLAIVLILLGCDKDTDDIAVSSDSEQTTVSDVAKAEVAKIIRDKDFGDMLVISSVAEPLNLIPIIANDSASHDIASYIYSSLIKVDKELNIVGDLAESWDISDDGKVITFHLKEGVKWHDGADFTAADVKFTYDLIVAESAASYNDDFLMIESVSIIDDYTISVQYTESYAPALVSWGVYVMPEHLLADGQIIKSPLQRNPIGTGAYIFEAWNTNQSISLRANHDFYDGRPYIEKIQFKYTQNQDTAFAELLAGDVDVMELTPEQYSALSSQQYNKYEYPSRAYTYVGYNLKRAPFDNKLVRQALSYAIPKEEIIADVAAGLAAPTDGIYIPDSYWYNRNIKKYDYDTEKALALFKEAGWEQDESGKLMKDGKQFAVTLLTNNNSTRAQIAEVLKSSWGELGINVSVSVLEWDTLIDEHINKGDFDAAILGWNIVLNPDPMDVWHSSGCGVENSLNFVCFQNAEADALLELGRARVEPAERKEYYDKFQEIIADEQPYTFLYIPYTLMAVSARVNGVEPAPAGIFYNYTDWYVNKDDQKYGWQ